MTEILLFPPCAGVFQCFCCMVNGMGPLRFTICSHCFPYCITPAPKRQSRPLGKKYFVNHFMLSFLSFLPYNRDSLFPHPSFLKNGEIEYETPSQSAAYCRGPALPHPLLRPGPGHSPVRRGSGASHPADRGIPLPGVHGDPGPHSHAGASRQPQPFGQSVPILRPAPRPRPARAPRPAAPPARRNPSRPRAAPRLPRPLRPRPPQRCAGTRSPSRWAALAPPP